MNQSRSFAVLGGSTLRTLGALALAGVVAACSDGPVAPEMDAPTPETPQFEAAALASTAASLPGSPDLVISQVYGAGGNAGAPYTHDFIELFNRGAAAVSLAGRSIQYGSATGSGNFGANAFQLTELPSVVLQPGQYYLVQQAAGAGGNGEPLPTPDLIDEEPIPLAAAAGKVVLVEGTSSLACNGGSTPCSPEQLARIIDLVGYGTANFYEGAAAAPWLNVVRAGQGVPVRFSLGGDRGLDIFATGYPSSRPLACDGTGGTNGVEGTTGAGQSSLSYDPETDSYTYVWKTERSWTGTCRELLIRFADSGDTYPAHFSFSR